MSSIREKIAARKEEAISKQLAVKAAFVAKYLGQEDYGQEDDGEGYYFKNGKISICSGMSDADPVTVVEFSQSFELGWKLVLKQEEDDVELFIPGEWEKELDRAVPLANEAKLASQRKEFERRKVAVVAEEKRLSDLWEL